MTGQTITCFARYLGVMHNMKLELLFKTGYKLFDCAERPVHFQRVDNSDPESIAHDLSLQQVKRRQLNLKEIENIGYNPISHINPEGMLYFFPRLIELALDLSLDFDEDPYLFLFIIQLINGPTDPRFSLFSTEQKEFVSSVLKFIELNYMDFIKDDCFEEDFNQAKHAWQC